MWGSRLHSSISEIVSYHVGNGKIIPWQHPQREEDASMPMLRSTEIFCHWISDEQEMSDGNLRGKSQRTFNQNNLLLIGAYVRLQPNAYCRCPIDAIKRRLRDSGALHEAGTISKSRYKDSDTVLFQVGWSGVNAGVQRSYKFRERTWKQSLVEQWKNDPDSRNPRILEYKLGVEVSICTQNARRRRLIAMLGSKTMKNFCDSLALDWGNPRCRAAFFEAVANTDHTAFRKLYLSNPE